MMIRIGPGGSNSTHRLRCGCLWRRRCPRSRRLAPRRAELKWSAIGAKLVAKEALSNPPGFDAHRGERQRFAAECTARERRCIKACIPLALTARGSRESELLRMYGRTCASHDIPFGMLADSRTQRAAPRLVPSALTSERAQPFELGPLAPGGTLPYWGGLRRLSFAPLPGADWFCGRDCPALLPVSPEGLFSPADGRVA